MKVWEFKILISAQPDDDEVVVTDTMGRFRPIAPSVESQDGLTILSIEDEQ